MTEAEAKYYSNFTIFSTQTWDVACDNGTAVCANFNDCECLNAETGEHQGTWTADEEARMMEAAKATRAYTPQQPYVPYAYFSVSQSHYKGQAPFNLPQNAAMWLRDPQGRPLNGTPALGGGPHMPAQGLGMESRLYDFSQSATRKFFLDSVMAPFVEAEGCDGVVWDEVTWLLHLEGSPKEYRSCLPDVPPGHQCTIGIQSLGEAKAKAYYEGCLQMVAKLSDYGIPKGKFPFYSTQSHLNFFPTVYHDFTQVLATHGGGRLWEFFCLHDEALFPEIGGLNSTCLNHVLTLQHEASLGIPAVVHAVFGALAHPRGTLDTVEFLLAAFLVACGEYQYVVVSPSNSWRLRPDGRDFALHDEYRQKLGPPQGLARRNGTAFRRSFQHAEVSVDVHTRAANISWLGGVTLKTDDAVPSSGETDGDRGVRYHFNLALAPSPFPEHQAYYNFAAVKIDDDLGQRDTTARLQHGMLTAATLPTLLTIDWQRLPDVPAQGRGFAGSKFYGHGFQNSDGGWLTQDIVVTAFGHGAGTFMSNGWLINVTAALALGCRGGPNCSDASWQQLPPAPVSGRQDVASAVINGTVYIVGGFSYSAPYTFSDFLRLRFKDFPVGWQWERLHDFPYPVCMHGVASIGSKLFVQGGADTGGADAFYNFHDHKGGVTGLGQRLYVYDTADETKGWVRLPDNPGPPRANAALSSVAGALFLIGGMSFVPKVTAMTKRINFAHPTAMTVVDNWRYDPEEAVWHRLLDLPVASGNFQTNG
jgi:hypothetical protein